MNKLKLTGGVLLTVAIISAILISAALMFTLGVKAAESVTPFLLADAGFVFIINVIAVITSLVMPQLRLIS